MQKTYLKELLIWKLWQHNKLKNIKYYYKNWKKIKSKISLFNKRENHYNRKLIL